MGNDAFFNLLFYTHIKHDKQGGMRGGDDNDGNNSLELSEGRTRGVVCCKRNFIISLAPLYCHFHAYTSSDERSSFMLR